MRVFTDPKAFAAACREARTRGELGLVPTMGYLHEGHASLMDAARRHRTSALTIFVNPTQFAANEDLSRYPRDLAGDLRIAEQHGVDLVLAPDDPKVVYPDGFQTWVEPGALATDLEGALRPGHFRGVATVVLKLLNLAHASHAYFGQKDYQQLAVVRRLVRDLDVPVEIVGCPIVREPDGLAMSSRNVYLTPDQRQRALGISRGVQAARRAVADGVRDARQIEQAALGLIGPLADAVDYVTVRDADSLEPIDVVTPGRAVLLVVARFGKTRLLDNAVLGAA